MIIAQFDFQDHIVNNLLPRIMFVRINEGVQVIGGTVFEKRKTLSFGYYLRHDPNPIDAIPYEFQNADHMYPDWNGEWILGVCYRVKCYQDGTVYPRNVAYANLIAPEVPASWAIFPYYWGNNFDRGVDFFKKIPNPVLANYHALIDANGKPILDWANLPQAVRDWVETTIVEAKTFI